MLCSVAGWTEEDKRAFRGSVVCASAKVMSDLFTDLALLFVDYVDKLSVFNRC